MVDFQLSDTVEVPLETTHHKIDELFLIIAKDIPTWIVLTKDEYKLYELIEKKLTLEESLIYSIDNYAFTEEYARKIMETLLYKIEESKFYLSTKPLIMDNANDIKKNIHVFITHQCNLQCPYCYVSAGQPLKDELSISEWKRAFSKLVEVAPNAEITFSGGEPLVKKGIFKIFEHTYNLGFKNILFTNGLLINDSNINDLEKYVSLIQISLDGLSSTTHDFTRGSGSFKKTYKSIELIISKNINLDLAINFTPHNIDEITNNLLGFLKKLSYKKLGVRLNYHMDKEGFAVNLTDDYFTVYQDNRDKFKKLIFQLIDEGFYNTTEKEKFKQLRNCGIGLSFGIDSNGDIYPCDKLYKSYGNIKVDDLNKISNEFTKLNEVTEVNNMPYCNDCDLKHICNGGCRINNIIATGSYTAPLCSNDYKLQLYEKLVYKF